MRRTVVLPIIATLALAACGGSDDTASTAAPPPTDAPAATEAPIATEAPVVTEAPVETAAPIVTEAPAATEAPVSTDAPAATAPPGATGTVAVSLVEWAVVAPTQLPPGPTTFAVSNDGDFRHHFGIARGDSYEQLPQLDSGAIDEEALGDDYLGRTENIEFGGSATIEFDLAPGNYVLFCNIIAGPSSHAAQGQVLSITVG